MNRKKKELAGKPFFTRFLEHQALRNVTGGANPVTLKWPSDSDEPTADTYHDV